MSSSVCVCRGCLATASECKLYDMRHHGLLTAYRQILQHTNSPVGEVELDPYMCSYCTALLMKCSAFRDRCMRVQDLLEHMSLSNVEVTTECINTIDRVSNKLTIPLIIDRNSYSIDTHTNQHMEVVIKKEIEYMENPCIKETDSDQEIPSKVVNNKALAFVTHIKGDTDDVKIKMEHTKKSFVEESDSDQEILSGVVKGKAVAIVTGDTTERNHETVTSIKKIKVTNKKENDYKDNNNKIGSMKDYTVGNKRRNTKDIQNLTNSKAIKTSNITHIIKEESSDSDIDDGSDSLLEEKDKEKNEKDNDSVSYDEKTDTEGTFTEIDSYTNVPNVVNDYNEKEIRKEKKKITKQVKNVTKKEGQRKPKIDDEIISKQYNVDIITLTTEEQRAEIEARKDSVNYKKSPYKCETCFLGWNSEETLNNHLQKHDEKSGHIICDICGYRFKRFSSLRDHRRVHQCKLVCRQCKYVSRSRTKAMYHHKKHMGHSFTWVSDDVFHFIS